MQTNKIFLWSKAQNSPEIEAFLRRPAFDLQAEAVAAELLADIRARGEVAVCEAAKRIDGVELSSETLRISDAELDEASRSVPMEIDRDIREAHRRVAAFAMAGMRQDWEMKTNCGGRLGERFLPLDRVGVYIPGGTAPLASTAIMTATLAKVAGVREIVACTPCAAGKPVNPLLLHALRVAGATEVYRVGGIQAIGLMAYGSRKIKPVQKIVGPGGAFVTAAKRQVYGHVALDLVAGPSEICVIADSSVKAQWLAVDLLSQIEHGTGHEKALFITDNEDLAHTVSEEMVRALANFPKAKRMAATIDAGGVIFVVAPSLDEGADLANSFAPEHLELAVREPERYLPKLTAAGAIFVGQWTPESVGDFAAGPSHVLPTGGAARMFSGLTVDDFRRRTSIVEYTAEDLAEALPVIETFGKIEGLPAHARCASIRMESQI